MSKRSSGVGTCEIERDGSVVRFILTCANDYEAMLTYDTAIAELATDGGLKITMVAAADDEDASR